MLLANMGPGGLMIFVMIPLPFTGAYIGTIASYIFGMNYRKSLFAISCGIIISCTTITYGIEFLF